MAGRRDRVMVAYPYGDIDSAFHRSLIHLLVYDAKGPRRIIDGAHLMQATTNLPHGRNQIVRRFLELDGIDWLWFVDTDQTFEPDVLERMLAIADKEVRIVGALVFSYDSETDEALPTIWTFAGGSPQRWKTYPPAQLVECGATGTGCVLIHRRVLEQVRDTPIGDTTYGRTSWPWFRYSEWENPDGQWDVMGEDLTFFARAHLACGFPVYVDTRIEVGHVKRWVVGSRAHLERTDHDLLLPQTWAIIPVKDQLEMTRDLIRQLREQQGCDGIVVLDNGSQRPTVEWLRRQADVVTIPMPDAGIHEMWNRGAEHALARWPKVNLLFLNNDLRIGEKFAQRLSEALRSVTGLAAVSPNYDGRDIPDGAVQPVRGICANHYDGTGGLAGFAFMVKGELFAAGYRFPEQCKWWFGDSDLTVTLDQMGAGYGLVGGVEVEHLHGGGQTGDWDADEMQPQLAADRAAFRAKWGMG